MDMNNPLHAPTMKLEGISKAWVPSREKGSNFRNNVIVWLADKDVGVSKRAGEAEIACK